MREREVEMMMKGLVMKQQQQPLMEENLSNLTCASGETSVSSGHRAENHSVYPHQHFLSPSNQPPPAKKKRNLPGNPDPDAQVIALSPRSLLATNRFVCEICNKGFQRDQNLQLHRRGHNLPWKLKQRNNKEVKKKVYVCPEAGCIHHDPSRALGDLTGIKKHFCRKHGEKKWKCEKCSKRYAVQSDWKAHSKICGTREYRCECGTIFSRRDSFITHRAFCDVLAQANEGSVGQTNNTPMIFMKKEEIQNFGARADEITAPWLGFSSNKIEENPSHSNNNRMGLGVGTGLINPYYHETNSDAHMSATALLQRAAQMGASMSNNYLIGTHQGHVSAVNNITALDTTNGFGLNLSAREVMNSGLFVHKAVDDEGAGGPPPHPHPPASSFLQEMMNSISSTGNYYNNGFDVGSNFEDAFNGMFDSKQQGYDFNATTSTSTTVSSKPMIYPPPHHHNLHINDSMTRDFLGPRGFSHADVFTINAGLAHTLNNSQQPPLTQNPNWQP